MKIFGRLYDRVLSWSRHRHAPRYLAALSFAESSFFPIPPDVLLAPMVLARPDKAFRYAMLTTVASVAGGLAGYALGYFAIELVSDWLHRLDYWSAYLRVREWFETWGFWAVFAAGFSPVPYKLFTISAGALAMSVPAFVIASLVGRGARFFLVAGLVYWGGARVEPVLRKYIDVFGWLLVAILVVAVLVF